MHTKELIQMLKSGHFPVATFTDAIEGQETCIEPGMRGRLISYREDAPECVVFTFDIAEFDEHNRPLETRSYFNPSGIAMLTAREANYYNPKEEVWGPSEGEVHEFVIENDLVGALIARFEGEAEVGGDAVGKSYVQWLENIVLDQTEMGKQMKDRFRAWCLENTNKNGDGNVGK
jgi:hypothetical protein